MKKFMAATAMLFAFAAWAAVDVNQANETELGTIKGVGPAMSKRILEAREQGAFRDWPDFMARVKGVKEKSASKLSAEGLTINGQAYGSAAAPAAAAPATAPATAPAAASTAAAPAKSAASTVAKNDPPAKKSDAAPAAAAPAAAAPAKTAKP